MTPRLRGPSTICRACSELLHSGGGITSSARLCRPFSTTPSLGRISTQRKNMYLWLQKHGSRFVGSPTDNCNYLGPLSRQPFPMNPLFRSQPVLAEDMREAIWRQVTVKGESLKAASAAFNVDVRRVAAVVRMKQIEKQMEAQGKPLAIPYAEAVLAMLPQSELASRDTKPHEAIGEIHGHKSAMSQLFVPASESRRFTREDAAKAFSENLLSADQRTPHPELVALEREVLQGLDQRESIERFRAAAKQSEQAVVDAQRDVARRKAASITTVQTERFEFRFENISVHSAGRDGRSEKGVGWRYGVPHFDRKKGLVKIPTRVPDVPRLN